MDWTKEVETKDGCARFYIGVNPVTKKHVCCSTESQMWEYYDNGVCCNGYAYENLVNTPEEYSVTIKACKRDGLGGVCITSSCGWANVTRSCNPNYEVIGIKEVTIKQGEGL